MPLPPFFHVSLSLRTLTLRWRYVNDARWVFVCVCERASISTTQQTMFIACSFLCRLPSCFAVCCCCFWVHQHNGNIQSESINEAVRSELTFNHMFSIHFYTNTHTHKRNSLGSFLLFRMFVVLGWENFSRTRNSRNICYFSHFDDLYILAMYLAYTYVCVCSTNNTDKRAISIFELCCFFSVLPFFSISRLQSKCFVVVWTSRKLKCEFRISSFGCASHWEY